MGFFQNVYFFYFLMVKNRKLTDNTSVPILVTSNVKVISKVKHNTMVSSQSLIHYHI